MEPRRWGDQRTIDFGADKEASHGYRRGKDFCASMSIDAIGPIFKKSAGEAPAAPGRVRKKK